MNSCCFLLLSLKIVPQSSAAERVRLAALQWKILLLDSVIMTLREAAGRPQNEAPANIINSSEPSPTCLSVLVEAAVGSGVRLRSWLCHLWTGSPQLSYSLSEGGMSLTDDDSDPK